ncbi:MAG: ABC-F family ATP-binding cassette domain-containing protein [Bacteroidota bacterium]|nr:ABC-F family ATP-binding cassette domain-containing protein [Bacteroidota bacterium]
MNLLSVDNVSKAYTEKWLFKNISFGIAKGEKLALVGANGTGKSTLLKTIAGYIKPDNGELKLANGCTIGYLPQEPELDNEKTILETIFSSDNPIVKTINEYEAAIADIEASGDNMQHLLDEMSRLDAWEFEKRSKQVLAKLGITKTDVLNSSLSGGQRKRVALAQLLLMNPDLIIMDEPTNHLDLEAIEWLENLLTAHNITLLMVTHDRYFLDNVSNQILELDRGNLYIHKGNYAYFLEKKSMRETIQAAEVSKARNLMVKELEWMRRMPKARGTKSKSRIEAFYDLKEVATQNLNQNELEISVQTTRLGNKIIEAHHVSKSFGELKIIEDFTYIFKKKDRIGVVGKNGIGKSTFLDLLTQKQTPTKGEVIHGSTLKIGYYTQHTNNLNNDNRIIDEVKEIAEYVTLGTGEQVAVSKLLDMFLFPPNMQHTPVSKLSGGERRRLQLLKVLVSNPNFLILDEPTNDLDIDTLNVLEDFLTDFAGCLLLVSHDRYFMDNLVEHLFVFEGDGKIKDFYGNYTDYKELPNEAVVEVEKIEKKLDIKPSNTQTTKKKMSFKEQHEFKTLEKEIADLELQKQVISNKLNNGSKSHSELAEWAKSIQDITDTIDEKSMRWIELSDLSE